MNDDSNNGNVKDYDGMILRSLESSPYAVVITDVDGVIEYVNNSFTISSGYSHEEVKGKTPRIIKSGNTAHETYNELWENLLAGEIWEGKIQNRSKNGHLYWEKETIMPMTGDNGEVVRFMAIKERIENPVPEQISKDQSSESLDGKRLALAVRSSRIGIWQLNLTNNDMIWDDMMLELFGITRADFKGNYQDFADRLYPEDLNQAEQEIHRLLAGKNSTEMNFRVVWPDDSLHHLETHAIIERGPDGLPHCLIGTARDITVQKESETEIIKARDIAEQADNAKSTFLTTVGHEIRTPLNGIMGMTSLLVDTGLNPGQMDILDTIRTSSDKLMSLLNDVLDYTAIEAGQIDLQANTVNITECVEEAIDIMSPQAIMKDIQLAYQIDESVPQNITTDNNRLRQILINLVNNAIKFTPRGHVVLTVESRHRKRNTSELHFAVRDTGVGIPRDKMQLLFKPFSQLDSSLSKAHDGAGLGLAISKRLTEALGGTIWVESQSGKGSVFHFTINAAIDEEPVIIRNEPISNDLRGMHLLIVDANGTTRRILYEISKAWGLQPSAVGTGAAALSRQHSGEPVDFLILADNLPDRSAEEIHRRLRKTEHFRFLPIIRKGNKDMGPPDSLSACIGKNIKPSLLRKTMESLLSLANREKLKVKQSPEKQAENNGINSKILLIESHLADQASIANQLKRAGHGVICADSAISGLDLYEKQHVDIILLDMDLEGADSTDLANYFLNAASGRTPPWIIGLAAMGSTDMMNKALDAGLHDFLTKPLLPGLLSDALKRAAKTRKDMLSHTAS